jgi:intron-binding protein aquarius
MEGEGGEGEDGGVVANRQIHRQSVQYCERFMEFIIDLLSQLPTRRFVRTVLDDRQLLIKSRMVPLHAHPAGRLYGQLVDLFRFYHGFEISDHTGSPLTDEDVASAHCDRLLQLQRLCFKHVEKLRELALSHCGAMEKRPVLTQHLSALDAAELHQLATSQLRLVDPEDPWAADPAFLLEVVVSAFEKRRSQRQAINEMPLYPNEDVLWDENVVPSIAYTGEGCLALPKLNLQFLTFHDYLLRNFNLFRLEATYEIRTDIADALQRMGPHRDRETGEVKFSGWARMATPVAPGALAVTEVRKPNVGEAKPAAVTCEVKIDLNNLRGPVRAEWDQIKQHDVLFLLAAEGPSHAGGQSGGDAGQQQHLAGGGHQQRGGVPEQNPAERYGLKYVRGAEVIEVRDGNNKLFNDFTGRIKPEEAALGPHGSERTYVLALDTAQYQLDVNRLVEEQGDDVYIGLNMLMRRKPKAGSSWG